MVKRIQIVLDDDEFEALLRKKGDRTWYEFLIKPHLEERMEER